MKYPIISTRDLSLLPDVATLERVVQSMAVICEISVFGYESLFAEYSINVHWKPKRKLAIMDNQQGDFWRILFTPEGAVMLGFCHTAEMSPWGPHRDDIWPNMFKGLPACFKEVLQDPYYTPDGAVTYCLWRKYTDSVWKRGPINFPFRAGDKSGISFLNEEADIIHDYLDGSAEALSRLDGNPRRFWQWANDAFADLDDGPEEIPLELIEAIYAHQPLTQAMVEALKPGLKLASIRDTLLETGYPLAKKTS